MSYIQNKNTRYNGLTREYKFKSNLNEQLCITAKATLRGNELYSIDYLPSRSQMTRTNTGKHTEIGKI